MKLLITSLALSISLQAFASPINFNESNMNEINQIEVYEVNEDNNLVELPKGDLSELAAFPRKRPIKAGIGDTIMIGRQLIAFGKEIYKIIEAGKPVVTIGETTPVSVLPKNELGVNISAFDLENWKMPKAKKYRVIAKNGFGSTMISFEFMLIFSYGGSYEGAGAYIAGAEVSATEVQVGWGYNLDANFKVQSIVNQGTKESPVAAAVLQIGYTMKTVLKETKSVKKFMINGNGQVRAY
jgi:hypothetical protein